MSRQAYELCAVNVDVRAGSCGAPACRVVYILRVHTTSRARTMVALRWHWQLSPDEQVPHVCHDDDARTRTSRGAAMDPALDGPVPLGPPPHAPMGAGGKVAWPLRSARTRVSRARGVVLVG